MCTYKALRPQTSPASPELVAEVLHSSREEAAHLPHVPAAARVLAVPAKIASFELSRSTPEVLAQHRRFMQLDSLDR